MSDTATVQTSPPTTRLSEPPKPDTAQMEAIKSEARTGAVTGKVVAEAIGNGISGPWRTFANLALVPFVCGMFWLMYKDNASNNRTQQDRFWDEIKTQREMDAKLRDSTNTEIRSFTLGFQAGMAELRAGMAELRGGTNELRSLVREMRTLPQVKTPEDK